MFDKERILVTGSNPMTAELFQGYGFPTVLLQGLTTLYKDEGPDTVEPPDAIAAVHWKLDNGVSALTQAADKDQWLIYASDITTRENLEGVDQTKPSRERDPHLIDVSGKDIPKHIFDRYSVEGGRVHPWRVVIGLQNDQSRLLAEFFVTCHVPQLSPELIAQYYSKDSSAGLLLLLLLRDHYPETTFDLLDSNKQPLGEISLNTAWNLIVNKVPPKFWFKQMHKDLRQHESASGFNSENLEPEDVHFNLSVLHLLAESDHNRHEVVLADGTMAYANWVSEQDAAEVSALLAHNFDTAPTYHNLDDNQRAAYKYANTPEKIVADSTSPNTALCLVLRNESNQVIGYIRVDNGESRATNGEPALVIKRFHVSREYQADPSTNNGDNRRRARVGTKLLGLVEDFTRQVGVKYVAIGSSGTSVNAFLKMGFQTRSDWHEKNLSVLLNLKQAEDVEAPQYVWLEKEVV